jgi:uncharacterized protein YgbK (DUF1537 family)
MNKLLLAFYGDDFTGSTDALEFLSKAGAKTVLFIEPPTVEQLSRYKDLDAIGVAGMTRAMAPAEMETELRSSFAALKGLGAKHVHYKVCSTFDSSPQIGSIGKAIDVGADIFPNKFIPLLVAAPALGRYSVFGNLFARMGIGSKGKIYRLDRHPSMCKHPVTPSDESDLRLHLAKQTSKKIGLVDILQVDDEDKLKQSVDEEIKKGSEIILFDALHEDQMNSIGKVIAFFAEKEMALFSAGSSGIEMALGNYWKESGLLKEQQHWQKPLPAKVLLVASGSCSPVTSAQITWALKNGFIEIVLETRALENRDSSSIKENISSAIKNINEGKSVIIHTNCGSNEVTNTTNTSEVFGTALGNIVREVAEKTSIKRIVIAGGDTSSYAARAMGIEAVEMIAPLSPGAPLCKAYAPGSAVDGLEINFKGGQVGSEDYFGMVLRGNSERKSLSQ